MISIIIPTFNEEDALPLTLSALKSQMVAHEVIVVDGGSCDATLQIAGEFNCQILKSPKPHRALQMNLGAQQALGETLVFLHADTILPPDGLPALVAERDQLIGGAFRRRYDSASPLLRLTCRLADFRGALWGWFLGDSAIFINRQIFMDLGGYREIAFFEDLDLALRMRACGRVKLLPVVVVSSARRFEKGGL